MDFSSHNPNTSNALNLAARNNNYKEVRRLLKKINPNCVDNRGWTCIHEAAHRDSYKSLVAILKHENCRPMCETHEGHTSLYLACRNKASIKTITLLLERVHDIANFGSTEGVTPLHIASSQGRVELVQLLLDYGALINVQDFDGDTPLHDAVLSVQYETVAMLLHAGADSSIANEGGYTPLHLAASKGSLAIVNEILPFVTNINEKTNAKHTAFMLSVLGGNIEVIDLLLKHGADPYLKDDKGNMALDIALSHGCDKIFNKMFSITPTRKVNKNLILNACKPHYFKMKILQLLLYSDLGPPYFDFDSKFHVADQYSIPLFFYTKNAPLNTYFNISEYIYNASPELFEEFFLLFLMRGVNVNAQNFDECPPLVYIQYCSHTNCFKSVFKILIEYGCEVDYISLPEHPGNPCSVKRSIPDAFKAALLLDPSIIPIMLPYSLYCEPGYLLVNMFTRQIPTHIPRKIQEYLYESVDSINLIKNDGYPCIPFFIPSLKQMCRFVIRYAIKIRHPRVKRAKEFVNVINNLPLPQVLCDYIRFKI